MEFVLLVAKKAIGGVTDIELLVLSLVLFGTGNKVSS